MPFEEINVYTPELYRSLGTPVRLDLGSTALDVTATRKGVEELPQVLGSALLTTNQNIVALGSDMSTKVAGAVTALKDAQVLAINAARDELKQHTDAGVAKVLEFISKIPAPAPTPVPAPTVPTVSARAAPLLSLLTQVQTLALDAKPGEPYKGKEPEFKGWLGENVAIHGLREAARKEAVVLTQAPPSLQAHFIDAFAEFTATDIGSRGRRFAEVHALIADVATFLA